MANLIQMNKTVKTGDSLSRQIGKRTISVLGLCLACMAAVAQVKWYNPLETEGPSVVCGQGWKEDGGNYRRLPARAKDKVRQAVWDLACESAGLSIRFRTDAEDIQVKYTVTGGFSMPHMPATGVSGVDLYRHADRGFCFGHYAFGDTVRYSYRIDRGEQTDTAQEYTLYLPLYNGVSHLQIGIPQQNCLTFVPVAAAAKPVVLYGTSIAQGACASRPGMAWGNIVSRCMEVPLVNLGFSGNGKLEPEVLDFIAEQDAAVFMIDCMANMGGEDNEEIRRRVKAAVRQLRMRHPETPILLIDHAGYSNGVTNSGQYDTYTRCNRVQAAAFRELQQEGVKQLFYLSHNELGLHPDAWVDYVHPSDFGMMQQAAAVMHKLQQIR